MVRRANFSNSEHCLRHRNYLKSHRNRFSKECQKVYLTASILGDENSSLKALPTATTDDVSVPPSSLLSRISIVRLAISRARLASPNQIKY